MAGAIDELPVDVAERISTPEEQAPPSPPPTEEEISDIDEDVMPQLTRFELLSQWLLLSKLCPLVPLLLCRIECPP